MPIYTMHIKNAPADAQRGAISVTDKARTLEEAKVFFATIKKLPLEEFNKLFIVKLLRN
tara:strand:- start:91 stop:267 length:177 start_codon:yes stop_codon:yes gene_type:complete